MNGTIPSEEKKLACEALITFAETVVPFSAEFDNFIKKMFPDEKPLLETLITHEFTAGRLGATYNGLISELTRELNEPEKIIATFENDEHDEILGKAYLAQAVGILTFRCHDAESEAPIV